MYFSNLKGYDSASDTHAQIISKINFGVNGSWNQVWSNSFKSSVSLNIKRESYEAGDNPNSKISNPNQVLGGFGVGADYKFLKSTSFIFLSDVSQKIYYQGLLNGPGIEFKKVVVLQMEAMIKHQLIHLDPFDVSAALKGIVLFPSSQERFNTKMGTGYGANITLGQNFPTKRLEASIFHQKNSQDSTILKIKRNELGFSLNISFDGPKLL